MIRRGLAVCILLAAAAAVLVPVSLRGGSVASAAGGPCGTMSLSSTHYTHVVWVWMENHSYSGQGGIIGDPTDAPYINNSLVPGCGLATNYFNISHPSLPNYIAATSGLSLGSLTSFVSDCSPSRKCETTTQSIFGQGESWKAYAESMPSNCDKKDAGQYAVRHNPPPYYKGLAFCKPRRSARHAPKVSFDVPYTQLAGDLANGTLPAFSFVTPNLTDDMHDGTIADGDTWLSRNLPTIFNSGAYQAGHVVVFITWDEGSGDNPGENCLANTGDGSCHVPTIVASPSTGAGSQSGALFNHYSLLLTTEQLLGLPALGQAAGANTMLSAFNL